MRQFPLIISCLIAVSAFIAMAFLPSSHESKQENYEFYGPCDILYLDVNNPEYESNYVVSSEVWGLVDEFDTLQDALRAIEEWLPDCEEEEKTILFNDDGLVYMLDTDVTENDPCYGVYENGEQIGGFCPQDEGGYLAYKYEPY